MTIGAVLSQVMDRQRRYYANLSELRELLNQPLPGGRGFQAARDEGIKALCREIANG